MTQAVSRRSITKGAAWAVPAVTVAAAAPAMAASGCGAGQTPTVLQRYTYTPNTFGKVGVDGALNTVSFWVTVTENTKPTTMPACTTWVDNTGQPVVMRLVNQRVAGSTGTRVRPISMTQANPNYTSTARTLDSAGREHPLGASDYEWTITFTPSSVYTMADHRFYVTLSNGDGGLIGGRIMNNLIVDGVVRIAQF